MGLIDSRKWSDLIKQIAGTHNMIPVKMFDANVDSVNVEKRTCQVTSIDPTLTIDDLEVRYMSDISDGEENVPEKDSTVTVIFSSLTTPVIVSNSWLTRKTIIIGDQQWNIIDGKQTFNDGSYGGIPIVKDPENSNAGLLKKINDLEKKINDLIQIFINWIPVPNDGGAALKTLLSSWLIDIILTQESDISNPNIVHGKKLDDA